MYEREINNQSINQNLSRLFYFNSYILISQFCRVTFQCFLFSKYFICQTTKRIQVEVNDTRQAYLNRSKCIVTIEITSPCFLPPESNFLPNLGLEVGGINVGQQKQMSSKTYCDANNAVKGNSIIHTNFSQARNSNCLLFAQLYLHLNGK